MIRSVESGSTSLLIKLVLIELGKHDATAVRRPRRFVQYSTGLSNKRQIRAINSRDIYGILGSTLMICDKRDVTTVRRPDRR